MKNRFCGRYYKFVANNQCFAGIFAESNEGKSIQIITKDKSYIINDIKKVQINIKKRVWIYMEMMYNNIKFSYKSCQTVNPTVENNKYIP